MLSTIQARACVCLLIAAVALNHGSANTAVAAFWETYRRIPLVQHDSFEPLVAVTAFFLWTRVWHFLDLYMPSLQGYKLHSSHDIKAWKLEGYPRWEAIYYLAPLLLFDWVYPRRKLDQAPPSVERVVFDVVGALLVYDFLFFFSHLALHKVSFLRRFHARHHVMGGDMRACDATRAHPLEELALVAFAIISLNVLRCHFLSRFVFNITIAYLLTEVHSGYDFPWMLHRVVPLGLVGGSVRHGQHHAKGDRYYQQFFTYLDDAYEWVRRKQQRIEIRRQD